MRIFESYIHTLIQHKHNSLLSALETTDTWSISRSFLKDYKHFWFLIMPFIPVLVARYVFNETVACTKVDLTFFVESEPHHLTVPTQIPPQTVLNTYMWGLALVSTIILAMTTAGIAAKLAKKATETSFWGGTAATQRKICTIVLLSALTACLIIYNSIVPTNCLARSLFKNTVGILPLELDGIGSTASSVNDMVAWGFGILAAACIIVIAVVTRLIKDDIEDDDNADRKLSQRLEFLQYITGAMAFTLISSYVAVHLYFSLGNSVLEAGRDQACKLPVAISTSQNVVLQITSGDGTGPMGTVTPRTPNPGAKPEDRRCDDQNAVIARYETLRNAVELYWAVITSVALIVLYFPAATTLWFRLKGEQGNGSKSPVRTLLERLAVVLSPLLIDAAFGISTSAVRAIRTIVE